MYLTDNASASDMYQYNQYGSMQRSVRHPPPAPTSIALDDTFDAMTTEAPTDWDVGFVRREQDYEESVTGYQNYVNEMERKLGAEEDLRAAERKPPVEAAHPNRNINGGESGRGARTGSGRRSLGSQDMPVNGRKVSDKRGKLELVESRIMEDGPSRTISLWRERVADSSAGSTPTDDGARSRENIHLHAKAPPNDSHPRWTVSDGQTKSSSVESKPRRGSVLTMVKTGKSSYERSEYMVAYHQPSKAGFPTPIYARSENGSTIPFMETGGPVPISPPRRNALDRSAPMSPTRRASRRLSQDTRSEFMVMYPQTPPRSGGSTGSSPSPQLPQPEPQKQMSPLHQRRASITASAMGDTSGSKATNTSSPVELILASCDPSLLHLSPILSELGIHRVEHLRAIARLSEATRDREVKEQALKKGVTIVEWAILMDKLETL
ncbi:uncharacterized protein FIBRA_01749 [Fibroporia radiculosa]|uniref:Uncharacterized protein n=1 Tax=Fibroporia radiculosa TaxID=599839 RepID=J4HTU2_9APHY|nr:uncharacterized protein FIBRA_01749 [Fibroporia radiculosa]CCL99727.1 predicted protein [Fibroporia radiculosa]